MKITNKIFLSCLCPIILSGCFSTSSARYHTADQNIQLLPGDSHNIDHLTSEKLSVASIKGWQNSYIFVQRGDIISIKSHGSWSPWPDMNLWSGPDGNVLWTTEVAGINGSALMARVGYKGIPFQVGVEKSFKARDYGMLYLAMNDPFNHLYNNKGEMQVEIYQDSTSPAASTKNKHPHKAKIVAYQYDDRTSKGSISATVENNSFAVRAWLLEKIGEIASSKNIALSADKNRSDGGAYQLLDESIHNNTLTIKFETVW